MGKGLADVFPAFKVKVSSLLEHPPLTYRSGNTADDNIWYLLIFFAVLMQNLAAINTNSFSISFCTDGKNGHMKVIIKCRID